MAMLVGLGAAMFACTPDDDDPVNPTPQPPAIKSTTDLRFYNFIMPEVPGNSSALEVSAVAPQAYGDYNSRTISYLFGAPRTLEWFGSDSATGRVNLIFNHVSTGTRLDASDQYDRRGGYWHFMVGSAYAPNRQNIRLVRRKYFDAPSDTTRTTFAYLNADPVHAQVKYFYNSVELGTANYGELGNTVPAFSPVGTDTLRAVDVATGRTIAQTEIGYSLVRPLSVIVLRAQVGRRAGRPDTIIYRHQVITQ